MDLMYGCGSEYDISLQELIECDLKSEMDRIMAATGGNADLMTELANSPLITDEGFDEFDIRFDGPHERMLDPFGLSVGIVSSGQDGVTTTRTSAKALASAAVTWNANSSLLNNGFSFDEQYGIMVDPSSIVPVSVSGSNGSSASSEGETDQELGVTDEEDEAELISGTIEGWILPQQTISSRTPSPTVIGEPEYELEEPEFIINEPVPEEPPAKKRKQKHEPQPHTDGKIYPKPAFSYSCLIAMALKNSKSGCLPVSEIYKFMCDHFPYFKSAPSGWKNSVRHNLSLNKCFEKIEKPGTGTRKGCLWALNPAKVTKMDEEVQKWSRKDPMAIRRAMSDPENLEIIEKGELKRDYSGNAGSDEDEEEDFSEPHTPITPVRLQARGSRASSSDSLISMGDSRVSSTTQSNIAQIRSNLLRPDHKIHLKDDTLDFGTITNVQGNYLCHANSGTNTYTLSFSSLHNSPTPLIIRRTPVK